jgi:RNA polymerase sigma-70 factor (sigma-E family)
VSFERARGNLFCGGGPSIGTTREEPILAARKQSQQEFDAFVEASAGRLVRAAYLVVGDLAEAEDLSQEALAKVARRWPRVRRMASPYGYARRVLFHLALEAHRRRRLRPTPVAVLPDVAVEGDAEHVVAREVIANAIPSLPPRQRATLVLRYWEQLTEAETAEVLGCSIGTVKSQTSKALGRLREVLVEPPQTVYSRST